MKKYIFIMTLLLSNVTWSMEREKHTPKTDSLNNLEPLLLSLQEDSNNKINNEKEAWKTIEAMSSRTIKTNPTIHTSKSPLFVMHSRNEDSFCSKL